MNIEAYDADSLRKMVRLLEYENKILKDKLKKAGISYEEVNPFEEKIESAEEYDLDQGSRIVNPSYITEKMAIRFFSMFWGREDVYARRGKNGGCNGVQREHNKKLNNGLPILHKVPPKRDYGRYFCIMAEKGGTSHGGLTEKLSLFFHAKKQEVNAYGR